MNFLVRFASKPLFYWVMTLELFRKFFGAVRAILWLCEPFFLAPDKVKVIPPKPFVAFTFVLILIGTDDVHIDTSPQKNTFAFAFVILKVTNSEIILSRFAFMSLFRFTFMSVSMVNQEFPILPVKVSCVRGTFVNSLCEVLFTDRKKEEQARQDRKNLTTDKKV